MKFENKTIENTKNVKDTTLLEDIIFYTIIIPIIIVSIIIIWQKIVTPDKIPDIFGYKMFIVLDENMNQETEYGDLVFTHNVDTNDLKLNDLIAFRNNTNKVTIHRIINITEDNIGKQFEMQNSRNEVGDTKYVRDTQVEGIIIYRIPYIGIIIYSIQKPHVILTLIGIVLLIGLIAYYIAARLDKRDMEKAKNCY